MSYYDPFEADLSRYERQQAQEAAMEMKAEEEAEYLAEEMSANDLWQEFPAFRNHDFRAADREITEQTENTDPDTPISDILPYLSRRTQDCVWQWLFDVAMERIEAEALAREQEWRDKQNAYRLECLNDYRMD